MSQRNLLILVAALVVLGLAVIIGQRSRAPAAATQGAAFVPGLATALDDLERVTLKKAGNETVATLEHRDGAWVVAEKSNYPADVAKLGQQLRALADAKILEQKTATPELYDRLGVADVAGADATGIEVSFAAAGKQLPAVILGDVQGTKYRYARRAGEQQSYLLDHDPNFPHATGQWLAPTIIDVKGERVQQVTIKHPDGETVTIAKTAASAQNYDVANVPKGRELLYPGVANVIGNALRELNLEDVQSAAEASGDKPVQVEYRTFDGLVVDITGSKQDDNAWITVAARYDADQAAKFPPPAAEPKSPAAADPNSPPEASPPPAQAAASAASSTNAADRAAEVDAINKRTSGWRYKIAAFQYDQMTRHMADLLKPPAG
ncbi:MAG TPA: DUF4340 domain-containing protein [Gammaproteobacteria bacterium]|nr:DUF4340 domain-containing protein [Gammaproteobacteria bacterium]